MGYLEEHKKSGLKVGDKVKIIKPEPKEGEWEEWENHWMDEMDELIGTVGEIIGDYEKSGFEVLLPIDFSFTYNFPYFALKKIEPKYETIMYIKEGEWVAEKRIIDN